MKKVKEKILKNVEKKDADLIDLQVTDIHGATKSITIPAQQLKNSKDNSNRWLLNQGFHPSGE